MPARLALVAATLLSVFQPMGAKASGQHFTVDSVIDAVDSTPGDGLCATSGGTRAVCTLRAAVQETNSLPGADTIDLPAGVYVLASSFGGDETNGDLDIVASDVKICGAGAETTIIDGNHSDRVFEITDRSDVTMCGVTIRNGKADGFPGGGGIFNRGSRLKLMGVTVRDNEAGAGGGIRNLEVNWFDPNDAALLTLDRSIIADNKAVIGGGIFNSDGIATLQLSVVSGNSSGVGGGVASYTAAAVDPTEVSLRIKRSAVRGNSAEYVPDVSSGSGGGVQNLGGTASIESSTITGNIASGSGAVDNDGPMTITNSTISANKATTACFEGDFILVTVPTPSGQVNPACGTGGIKNFGSLEVHSATITDNTAPSGGGLTSFLGTATIGNTIISANSPSNCDIGDESPMTSLGHNLESKNVCHFNHPTDLLNTDPKLGALANNGGPTKTHALLVGSAAIDAAAMCPAKDQRGLLRPAACDIGAYEQAPYGDLAIDKTVDCDSVRIGGTVGFLLKADNFGSGRAANLVVTDSLPPSLGFVSVEASDGTCSILRRADGGQDVVCSVGSLAPNGTLSVFVTVRALSRGTAENLALISSSDEDRDPTNNVARASVRVDSD
jgi:uncharacterized repeat protein (TIGR01451 family)